MNQPVNKKSIQSVGWCNITNALNEELNRSHFQKKSPFNWTYLG